MWNDLLDDNGRRRGSIFYKAAFYDRRAHMKLESRFSLQQNYETEEYVQWRIHDGDSIVFETAKIECERYSDKYFEAADAMEEAATAWLDENYPEWKNPSAYWD